MSETPWSEYVRRAEGFPIEGLTISIAHMLREVDRLNTILAEAPHAEDCRTNPLWGPDSGPCDCWKSKLQ